LFCDFDVHGCKTNCKGKRQIISKILADKAPEDVRNLKMGFSIKATGFAGLKTKSRSQNQVKSID
jgi:hypothetical protein